jgi:hypothetical protein
VVDLVVVGTSEVVAVGIEATLEALRMVLKLVGNFNLHQLKVCDIMVRTYFIFFYLIMIKIYYLTFK